MRRLALVPTLFLLAACDQVAHWDEIRNKPEQQVHDKRVCVGGGMDYATNAYGEVKCIHPNDENHRQEPR